MKTTKKKIKMTVEKTNTGFSAYADDATSTNTTPNMVTILFTVFSSGCLKTFCHYSAFHPIHERLTSPQLN